MLNLQYQNVKTDTSHLEVISNASTAEIPENDTFAVQEFQKNEVSSVNLVATSENAINHDKVHYSVEETTNTETIQEMNIPEMEKKVDLNDFPKVQKEHLLKMASAVADVLTNESEYAETSLDSDLICQNQFLSSYLEEQKKIVNELHIELSNAVSIHISFAKNIEKLF